MFVAAGLSAYNLVNASLFLRESIPDSQRKKPNLEAINIIKPIKNMLRQPILNRVAISFAAFNMAFAAFISLLVLALKQLFDWTPVQTSGLFVIVGITLTIAQVALIGKVVRLWGEFSIRAS